MSSATMAAGQAINLAQAVDYAAGSVVSKTLVDKPAGSLTLFAFDAGQGLSEHTSPYGAVVQVLDGEVEIMLDGQPHVVSSGELFSMPAHLPHALRAVKKFKMLLIMIREKMPPVT
ncbi:MAG: cupin domain-containing protein [Kiritimatiellia bacterium]|nr:cupin domain-containing protein [Lentisphaerota bacterium]